MKTTFKRKVIFETDNYQSYNDKGFKTILTMESIKKEIDGGKVKVETINGNLGTNNEPTLIITSI